MVDLQSLSKEDLVLACEKLFLLVGEIKNRTENYNPFITYSIDTTIGKGTSDISSYLCRIKEANNEHIHT